MLPPSSPEKVWSLIREMENYYSAAFNQFEEDEMYYDGELDKFTTVPAGYDTTIPTTGRAIVDEAVDNIIPTNIKIEYEPRDPASKEAEKDADAIRTFCKSLYWYQRQKAADIDFVRAFQGNLFRSGKSATKLMFDETLWPSLDADVEEEVRKEGGKEAVTSLAKRIKRVRNENVPYYPRTLGPRQFMEDPTVQNRKLWLIERYSCDSQEVKQLYEHYDKFNAHHEGIQTFEVHEFWSAPYIKPSGMFVEGRHMIFVRGDDVLDEEISFADIPFCVKYSGMGREGYDGEPEIKAGGLYSRQVKSLIKAEIRRFSQVDAILAQLAFPIGVIPESIEDIDFDTSPGAMNPVPDRIVEMSNKLFIQVPIPDADYLRSMQVISAQIERGTTQVPLRGAPVPGTDSAAQLTQYIGQAQLRLESCKQATEDMLSWYLSSVLREVEERGEEVSVPVGEGGGKGPALAPKQIGGCFQVRVTFLPNEEQIKDRKLSIANDAIVKGGMGQYDALVYAGFENATDIVNRRRADDILNEPEIRRALGKMYLKEAGIEADELKMGELVEQGIMSISVGQLMQIIQQLMAGGQMNPGTQPQPGLPPGEQDPTAALMQAGMGPMEQPVGAPVQDPALMNPGQIQGGGLI